jgi:hypothetical protein
MMALVTSLLSLALLGQAVSIYGVGTDFSVELINRAMFDVSR